MLKNVPIRFKEVWAKSDQYYTVCLLRHQSKKRLSPVPKIKREMDVIYGYPLVWMSFMDSPLASSKPHFGWVRHKVEVLPRP